DRGTERRDRGRRVLRQAEPVPRSGANGHTHHRRASAMSRKLKFFEALREAQDLCMAKDPAVYVMGLGVPDPKGIFGTTLGLREKYGPQRVLDMPLSENAMTGIATGSALVGFRPVITHQRVD